MSGLHACTVSCPAACQSPPPGTAIVDSLDCGLCAWKNACRPPGLVTNSCVNLLPGPFPGANRTDSCINRLPGPSPGATRTNLCMNLLSDKPARNKKTRYIITYNIFLNNLYPVFLAKTRYYIYHIISNYAKTMFELVAPTACLCVIDGGNGSPPPQSSARKSLFLGWNWTCS